MVDFTGINGKHSAPFKIVQFKYNPKPDISAYEVALLLPIFAIMVTGGDMTKIINNLPDEARRHFEVVTE